MSTIIIAFIFAYAIQYAFINIRHTHILYIFENIIYMIGLHDPFILYVYLAINTIIYSCASMLCMTFKSKRFVSYMSKSTYMYNSMIISTHYSYRCMIIILLFYSTFTRIDNAFIKKILILINVAIATMCFNDNSNVNNDNNDNNVKYRYAFYIIYHLFDLSNVIKEQVSLTQANDQSTSKPCSKIYE